MAEELALLTKEWLKTENEINKLKFEVAKFKTEIKKRNQKNEQVTNKLLNIMKQNELDYIDLKNEQLIHSMKTIKQTISKKYLVERLEEYFEDDVEAAKELEEFILEGRNKTVYNMIRRKEKK